ncbi:hypothetical protein BP6252_12680 [Coleophoma cylindrospora]|uniref:Uncharacterized protein n=1 Tax=Coleophoma cylindrospora TaxID=1849047 RepID=A0A3D8QCL7_9HELO|nr:hypothetical protein BP6252_12680 [Coleophoma cylindrospora]
MCFLFFKSKKARNEEYYSPPREVPYTLGQIQQQRRTSGYTQWASHTDPYTVARLQPWGYRSPATSSDNQQRRRRR